MKKLRLLALLLVLMIIIFGCSQPNEEAEKAPADIKPVGDPEKVDLGFELLTIVVPHDAGGSNDIQARAFAPYLSAELGVPVVIENRPGGSGMVGWNTHLDNDPTDGSFLVYVNHSTFGTNVIRENLTFDQFDHFGVCSSGHRAICVGPDPAFDSIDDMFKKIEENPGKYMYAGGSGWKGAIGHMLQDEFGLELREIPIDGGSNSRLALISGDVDFMLTDIETMKAKLEPGTWSAIGMVVDEYTGDENYEYLNDYVKSIGSDFVFPNMVTDRYFQVKKGFKDNEPEKFELIRQAIENACNNTNFLNQMKGNDYNFSYIGIEEADVRLREALDNMAEFEEAFK